MQNGVKLQPTDTGHRSLLFPAFAKISNSPYFIKRLLRLRPRTTAPVRPARHLSAVIYDARCLYEYLFHFLVAALTPKVIGILCF
jgi:hypothetical protein